MSQNNSLCQLSNNEILKHVPTTILRKYKHDISSHIQIFLTNHKDKLQNAIHISTNQPETNIHCKHLALYPHHLTPSTPSTPSTDKTIDIIKYTDDSLKYTIPPFIEIFKYLANHSSISKHFTSAEHKQISRILSSSTPHHIYKSLHSQRIGNKLATLYSKYGQDIDLTRHFPTMDFHNLLFNSFTSYTILEEIASKINTLSICNLETTTKKYPNFLYLFHSNQYNQSNESNKKKILELVNLANVMKITKEIAKRVIFLNTLLGTDKLPNRLIIFLTDAKKEIDDTLELEAHFKTINVNTAVTNMQDIIIYRKEELYKSIFHELIHFHNLDYKILSYEAKHLLLEYLHKSHNISTDNEYLVYEAITESLANVLNNLYMAKTIEEFGIHLEDEIIFSTFQVAKILRVCKFTSWEEFTLQTGSSKQWKQDSCVFSYYVLKLYLLLNLDEYWTLVLDKDLKFHPSINNFKKLINIFEKGRNHQRLKEVINYLLSRNTNEINKKKTKKTKNTKSNIKINKTLRMTCLDA